MEVQQINFNAAMVKMNEKVQLHLETLTEKLSNFEAVVTDAVRLQEEIRQLFAEAMEDEEGEDEVDEEDEEIDKESDEEISEEESKKEKEIDEEEIIKDASFLDEDEDEGKFFSR